MTTTILLIRHGQTEPNVTGLYMGWSDDDLNETGYSQARRLSSSLATLPISSIYASRLRRTYTTATILAEPHKIKPKTSEDFIEIRLGDWQGLSMDVVRQRWPELWQQSRIDPSDITLPNGESFQQVTERAIRGFETVAEANMGKHTAIVTHEIIVKVLIAHVLRATNSIYRRMEIENTSLSMVRIDDGKARLVTLNNMSHLEG